jgi:DNA-binding winged helix-turn-helix (wHTH) protein
MDRSYAFGAFILRPERRQLRRRSGEVVEIQPKAFDALICLIEHAGRVVPRRVLMSSLWPATVVEDNNLTRAILTLRRALGDTGPQHQYVATVPRRGYQLVAGVIEVGAEVPAAPADAEGRAPDPGACASAAQPRRPRALLHWQVTATATAMVLVIAGVVALSCQSPGAREARWGQAPQSVLDGSNRASTCRCVHTRDALQQRQPRRELGIMEI